MPVLRYTTTDLYLAAYLMYHGADVLAVTKLNAYSSTITLAHRNILSLVDAYTAYRPMKFSPRAFGEKRDELKRLIKSQPNV